MTIASDALNRLYHAVRDARPGAPAADPAAARGAFAEIAALGCAAGTAGDRTARLLAEAIVQRASETSERRRDVWDGVVEYLGMLAEGSIE